MTALRKDLTTDGGATFTLSIRYLDSAGVAVNLLSYTANFVLHTPAGVLIQNLSAGVTADGWINVVATDEQTALWPVGKSAYNLDISSASGVIERLFFGDINVRFNGLAPVVIP